MDKMLEEIEAMIIEGNQRTENREKAIKMAVLKAKEAYSAMNMPSIILKKPDIKKQSEEKAGDKNSGQKAGADILTCDSCGKDIKPDDVFCAGCGLRVEKVDLPEANTIEIPLICSCGRPWQPGTKFCGACGAKRPVVEISDRICPKGHINTPDSGFCYICGEKIV